MAFLSIDWLVLFVLVGNKIPGGATLIFDVELLGIGEGHQPMNYFKEIDTDNDNLLSQDEVKCTPSCGKFMPLIF